MATPPQRRRTSPSSTGRWGCRTAGAGVAPEGPEDEELAALKLAEELVAGVGLDGTPCWDPAGAHGDGRALPCPPIHGGNMVSAEGAPGPKDVPSSLACQHPGTYPGPGAKAIVSNSGELI